MNELDRQTTNARYNARFEEFGLSPEALGWREKSRQDTRFRVFWEIMSQDIEASVLDVGCGFGDLACYLRRQGWEGTYVGIDINDRFTQAAKSNSGEDRIFVSDISEEDLGELFDYVFACGIFNSPLPSGGEQENITSTLRGMLKHAKKLASADFLSPFADFQKDVSYHPEPDWLIKEAARLSKRFQLRHDYMPYECMLTLYSDAEISDNNIFSTSLSSREKENS